MARRFPSVAVVVPTYNRSALLRRTLNALGCVDYPSLSVVVVDDGSGPEHAAANESATREAHAVYLEQANAGPATARNRGIAASDSVLVAFLDDDCAPREDWLRALAGPFSDSGASRLGGVGGGVRSEPAHNWVSRFCSVAQYSTGAQSEFKNAATANACFRRDVLEEVNGFDEGFRHPGGDDPDLSRRIREAGYELRNVPEAIVYHAEIDRLGDFLLHLFRRGLGEARGKRKEGRTGWVLLRALLFPIYCLRRAGQTWRVAGGQASILQRLLYATVDGLASLAFVAGSVVGLAQRR
jgi:GT2 family glycosyltransferase